MNNKNNILIVEKIMEMELSEMNEHRIEMEDRIRNLEGECECASDNFYSIKAYAEFNNFKVSNGFKNFLEKRLMICQ